MSGPFRGRTCSWVAYLHGGGKRVDQGMVEEHQVKEPVVNDQRTTPAANSLQDGLERIGLIPDVFQQWSWPALQHV